MKKLPLLTILTAMIMLSCQKETTNSGPASIKVYLTDHQTPIFDSVFIDIRKLEVKLEDDTLPNGGWIELSIHPGIYNILRFRNGLDTLFATGTLPGTRLRKIRMTLGDQNSVMKDGQSFALRIHDNDNEVVANIDDANFDLDGTDQVLIWIDFDAGRSIQVDNSGSGNNNGFRLKSHIKVFTKRKSGRIEGRVLPNDADAIVMAISGSDTATAIPENDGEFKIVGLNAGTYRVFFDGDNGYRDTTINNVLVRNNEDTHLPTVTLRR